ncbi:MFS transporter [Sporolactobacillus shoreicorticis]|uniref:MFS transporter n=1 Tax=Sporolactobacillus shoreicorticis TaxID=1923877 RepID=A0ABW5S5J0_9BACL|nr:MFS transporter [Sporolactobacillus shoreicorticis]MCO7127197.1 MFS transporter [Sporolactobacillus shoreicorticis]
MAYHNIFELEGIMHLQCLDRLKSQIFQNHCIVKLQYPCQAFPKNHILLAKNTPLSISSSIFGYNQSFQSAGIVIGPFLGAFIASSFGYRGVFLVTALLFCTLVVVNKSAGYQ